MKSFDERLAILISEGLAMATGDPEAMGDLIERLARGVGFAVSIATGGNPKGIDEFVMGISNYIHEEAVDKSKFARFMAENVRK